MRKTITALFKSPVVLGALMAAGWYTLILWGPLNHPTIRALFTEHPVEHVSAILFFVGIGSLLLRTAGLLRDWRVIRQWPGGWNFSADDRQIGVDEFIDKLSRFADKLSGSRLGHRMRELARMLETNPEGPDLDSHLRILSEKDAAAAQARSTLVRMFIWAIPILGFLGTVIGIAMALGRLAPQQLEESLPVVMAALTVAFNTTILALALCLILYFGLYVVERAEAGILGRVDQIAEEVLAAFARSRPSISKQSSGGTTPSTGDQFLALLQAPLATWELAVQEFVSSVRQLTTELSTALGQALAKALEEVLHGHAARLLAVEEKALAQHQEHLDELYRHYHKRLERVLELERSVEQRTEMLLKALEGAETLRTLQEALQRNLAILATSRQFEQMLMSLTAAIHLLTTRIEAPVGTPSAPQTLPVHVHGLRQAG